MSNIKVDTLDRLAELWPPCVSTELVSGTDDVAVWGAAVLDGPLLAVLLLLLLPLLPGGLELLVRGEDIAGTIGLTERHLQMTDGTLRVGALCEVAAGVPAVM